MHSYQQYVKLYKCNLEDCKTSVFRVTKVYFWGGMAAKRVQRASLPTITMTKTITFIWKLIVNSQLSIITVRSNERNESLLVISQRVQPN